MWCLETCFSGGLDSVRLTIGLNDLKNLFQPKQFYDSVKTILCPRGLHSYWCAGLGGHDNKQSNEQIVSICVVQLHAGYHLAYHHTANLQF